MAKSTPQFVYVVVNPYWETCDGYWIKGVYATMEGASYAAHEMLNRSHPEDRDKVNIHRYEVTDTVKALASLKTDLTYKEAWIATKKEEEKLEIANAQAELDAEAKATKKAKREENS